MISREKLVRVLHDRRSDFTIPGHLLTYPSTLLRTKHIETKGTT